MRAEGGRSADARASSKKGPFWGPVHVQSRFFRDMHVHPRAERGRAARADQRTPGENCPVARVARSHTRPGGAPLGGPRTHPRALLHAREDLLHGPGEAPHVVRDFSEGARVASPNLARAQASDLRFWKMVRGRYSEDPKKITHNVGRGRVSRPAMHTSRPRGPSPAACLVLGAGPVPVACPAVRGGRAAGARANARKGPFRGLVHVHLCFFRSLHVHARTGTARAAGARARPGRGIPRRRPHEGPGPAECPQSLLGPPPSFPEVWPHFWEGGGKERGAGPRRSRGGWREAPGLRPEVVGLPRGQRPRVANVVGLPIGQLHRPRDRRRARQLGFSY